MTAGWSHGHRSMTVRSRYNHQFESENRQMIERSPAGDHAASRRWPFGRHNREFPTVALGSPCGDRQAAARWPNDEWIIGTSADHPANFNCELKCSGRRRMSPGWALQECLFGRPPPDFCRIWCKTRRPVIRRSIFIYCDVAFMFKHLGSTLYTTNVCHECGMALYPGLYVWCIIYCTDKVIITSLFRSIHLPLR